MAASYKKRILDYCTLNGIEVPPGFGRHSVSRYAIVRVDTGLNKLIARTWFNVADVLYYLDHVLVPELGERLGQSIRILDFKENQQLEWNGSKQLIPVSPLT